MVQFASLKSLEDIKISLMKLTTASNQKRIGFNDSRSNIVYLNIGGTYFQTFEHTLTKFDSIFRQIFLLKDPTPLYDKNGRLFFDRSPKYFRLILQTLQNEKTEVEIPENDFKQQKVYLEKEINYYGFFQNSLTVKPIEPPKPPEPTKMEKFLEFILQTRTNLLIIYSNGVPRYVHENKKSLLMKLLFLIPIYLIIFTILLFFVSIGLIKQRMNILFWPFYGISFSIHGFTIISYFSDKHTKNLNLGSYIVGFSLNVFITLSFSILFSKIYYWYHDLSYFSWWVVNILPLIASLFVSIIYTLNVLDRFLKSFKKFMEWLKLENIVVLLIPYNLFWNIFSLSLYMDGIYFKNVNLILIPLLIHVGLWIRFGYTKINNGYLSETELGIAQALCRVGYSFQWMILSSLLGFHGVFSVLPFTICSLLTLKTGLNF